MNKQPYKKFRRSIREEIGNICGPRHTVSISADDDRTGSRAKRLQDLLRMLKISTYKKISRVHDHEGECQVTFYNAISFEECQEIYDCWRELDCFGRAEFSQYIPYRR